MVQVTPRPSLFSSGCSVTTSLSKNIGNYTNQAFRTADEVEDDEQFCIADLSPSSTIFITITPDNVPNSPFSNLPENER